MVAGNQEEIINNRVVEMQQSLNLENGRGTDKWAKHYVTTNSGPIHIYRLLDSFRVCINRNDRSIVHTQTASRGAQ